VRGGDLKPFDAVRAEITEEVGKQLAQRKYAEAAEQFSNLVYEQSDSLQPAMDRLKLIRQTAKVGRQPVAGAKGPLASGKLLDALFSSESIKNKHNTEAVETGPNQLVSARVLSYLPDHVRPLDEVKPQVLAAVRAEQAGQAARKDALNRLAAVKLDLQAPLGQTLTVSRTETQGLARGLVDAALKADLSKLPVALAVDLGAEGQAILKVVKSIPRAAADADDARARPYVGQALAAAESAAYFEALKRRYKVKISAIAPGQAAAASAASASF
jgi:peptidyl-prolyl cis-trans isomerase D